MSPDFSRLEAQKTELLSSLQDWSAERLRFRPTQGSWSAVQVLDHLVKTEHGIQLAAHKGLATPHRLGVRDRMGTWFLDRIFRSNRKVKVPSSADLVLPDPEPELPEVLARWNSSRLELFEVIQLVPAGQRELGIFHHPVGGWMRLADVLNFFSVHMHHHGFQLQTLREASASTDKAIPG